MKKFLLVIFLIIIAQQSNLYSGVRDIDGTAGIQYVNVNQVFPKGISLANGFVRFNNGITIADQTHAQLDTFITVSGGLDIRNTGTLDLLSDLYLSSHFTFSTSDTIGGFIKGRGNTIHFGGNVTLQQGKMLQFIDDTIIDGGGKIFSLGAFSQLLVDHNVTLTLRNMTFKNTHNSVGRPSIRLMSPGSKLALQDVKFAMADEFAFHEGQLFIHDDVMVTGTSMFSYRSAAHCHIDTQSTLLFDKGTTYFHYPKTTLNNQLYMQDVSSILAFNNSTLLATHTGMQITRGTLCFDNGVTVSSFAAYPNKVAGISLLGSTVIDTDFPAPSGSDFKCQSHWSHDQRFSALAEGNHLEVYSVGPSSIISKVAITDSDFSCINSIAWSHDDRHILLAGQSITGSGLLKVYDFTLDNLVINAVVNNTLFSEYFSGEWSHDNNYIILAGNTPGIAGAPGRHATYALNGSSLSLVEQAADIDTSTLVGVALSDDNRYVAISGISSTGTGIIKVYSFNAGIVTLIASTCTDATFFACGSCAWSADNNYLFVSGVAGTGALGTMFSKLGVYRFSGTGLLLIDSCTNTDWSAELKLRSMSLSPDGRNVVIGGQTAGLNGALRIFEFTGSSLVKLADVSDSAVTAYRGVDFSPDGKFLFVEGETSTNVSRSLYHVNYCHDTSAQGFCNGIIFGDASLGRDYDLDVEVFGGARVEIDGTMFYNNVV